MEVKANPLYQIALYQDLVQNLQQENVILKAKILEMEGASKNGMATKTVSNKQKNS